MLILGIKRKYHINNQIRINLNGGKDLYINLLKYKNIT
jgi:hypothetical protein